MSIAAPQVRLTPSNRAASPKRRHKQSRLGLIWLGAMLVLAGWSVVVAYREHATTSVASASRASSATNRKPRQRRIADMRTGYKVLGTNPTGDLDLSLGELVDAATRRNLVLVSQKTDGSRCQIELLRSLDWIAEHSAVIGGKVRISVPECGIDGDADLLAIEPCPPIESGEGRVVTGTFKHSSAHVVELRLARMGDSIITTRNHLFWSEDRKEFVRTDGLRANERLRGRDAPVRVASVIGLAGTRTVYNLEVHLDHVFHVGGAGVLVHNGGLTVLNGCFDPVKIGFWNGDDAEVYLSHLYPGGTRQFKFTTGVGTGATRFRYADLFIDSAGVAHESKVGFRELGQFERKQIGKDAWLLANHPNGVNRIAWHFFRSAETGKIGPSPELLEELVRNGIEIIIYD